MRRSMQKFTDYLEVEKNYSEHTLRGYLNDINELSGFLDNKPPQNVTHLDIRRFLAELSKRDCSKRTIVRKLAAIRSFFKFPHIIIMAII